jgi:hypothetical protein
MAIWSGIQSAVIGTACQGATPPRLQDRADDPRHTGSMGCRGAGCHHHLSRQQEASLGQHRDRRPVAEPDAQFAQRAGLLIPTSGFSGSFRHARFGAAVNPHKARCDGRTEAIAIANRRGLIQTSWPILPERVETAFGQSWLEASVSRRSACVTHKSLRICKSRRLVALTQIPQLRILALTQS